MKPQKGYRFFTVRNGRISDGILINEIEIADRHLPVLTLGKHDLIRHVPIEITIFQEKLLERDKTLLINCGNASLVNTASEAIVLTSTDEVTSNEKVVILFQGGINALTGDSNGDGLSYHPFPGDVISHTNTELLAVVPRSRWVRAGYDSPLHGEPRAHYYRFVGSKLIVATEEMRQDFQLLLDDELATRVTFSS